MLFGEYTGMLMDEEYISRYGFLPNSQESYNADGMTLDPADLPGLSTLEQDEHNNPSHFPVGFVRTRDFTDRATNRTSDMLGLTCAACHTGQINFEGIGYRIDGGAAMTDLGLVYSKIEGGFLFDTTLPGNSNQGHEFAGSPDPEHRDYWWNGSKGRIGPELVTDDRLAIMEFLKTLPGEPVRRSGN
ncbi:MAG TPA: hypothetical protein EYO97_15775 [Gemmatimonadetes bacterium]|nr:hypothetical protein [Gemmatimonadota bacterium]